MRTSFLFCPDLATNRHRPFHLLVFVSLVLTLAGCQSGIQGPQLQIDSGQTFTQCGDVSQPFKITGQGISPMVIKGATSNPQVELPDICLVQTADSNGNPVTGATETCIPDANITWVSQSEIDFTVPQSLGLPPGQYDVIVRNPNGDEVRGQATLTIQANAPALFWADPAVVYNGISTQITVYGSNLAQGSISSVVLRDQSSNETDLTSSLTFVAGKDNRFQVVIPAGQAAGTYDLVVTAGQGCQAFLLQGLQVTSSTQQGLVTQVDPAFGGTGQSTPVTITGSGFMSVPRVYLNPVGASSTTVASALSSVAFIDGTRLTGIVPSGLPAGQYDLIVVNPDGNVGLLPASFTVTSMPPPVVDDVSPGTITNQTSVSHTVQVQGNYFRNQTATFDCKAPDGTPTQLMAAVSASTMCPTGVPECFDATLTGTQAGMLPAGSVCVLRVADDDGSYFDFSAVGITGSSANLSPFELVNAMQDPRRALVAAAGRATQAARFLYAIGGDDGDPSTAYSSIDTAPVDIYGDLGSWFYQSESLAAPRTLAGLAQIGRYLYLVGGNDGSGPTTAVSRAMILDPAQAPDITDVSASRHDASVTNPPGIGPGVWYYRVSAVMDAADESNPGGETLASDPIAVNLPASLMGTLDITLVWSQVPGAAGYRIYRSPTGTEAFGNEQLVGEVTGGGTTTFTDTGGSPTQTVGPLPLGSTGVWKAMPSLTTARVSAGVAAAQDPSNPNTWYVYAVGGLDGSGTPVDSWERLDISVDAMGVQTAAASWQQDATDVLSAARSELGLYSVTATDAPVVGTSLGATSTVLYAGGGLESTNVDGAEVQAGGALSWSALTNFTPNHAGYGMAASAGYLFAFGGLNGGPSASSISGQLQSGTPPDVANYNNLGNILLWARVLMGSAHESSFVYLIGGYGHDTAVGGPDAVTNTIERTVL